MALKGTDFYTAVSTLIDGFSMDSVLFYQLLNAERIKIEMKRPWRKLRKYRFQDSIGPVSASPVQFPPTASISIPSDFLYLSRDGEIPLYNNNNQWQIFTEIPIGIAIPYLQENNRFFVDYTNNLFYFTGTIDQAYTAYLVYQADLGDITASTSWTNIPDHFAIMLALFVAARQRLGIDYDDINARNADDNLRAAQELFEAMVAWDDQLQRSSIANLNYPTLQTGGYGSSHRSIDING